MRQANSRKQIALHKVYHIYYNSKTNATFIKQKQTHGTHYHIEIRLKQYDKIVEVPSPIFDKSKPKFQHLFCSIT